MVRQNSTHLSFAAQMLDAVPDVYDGVDFITMHACEEHQPWLTPVTYY